jgi:hypothetical protein
LTYKKDEMMEMIELLFLPKQCIHIMIKERLQGLSESELPKLGPCGHLCWFCRESEFIPLSSIDNLKDQLEGYMKERPFLTLAELPSLFMENRDLIWSSLKEKKHEKGNMLVSHTARNATSGGKNSCTKVRRNSSGRNFLIMNWNRFKEKMGEQEVLAYHCVRVWKCIPVHTI